MTSAGTVVEFRFGLSQSLLRLVVVEHNIEPGAFQIVELAARKCEPKHCADHEHYNDAQWNEQEQNVHVLSAPTPDPAALTLPRANPVAETDAAN